MTQEINQRFCKHLGYEYVFLELDNNKYGNMHPATKKIHIVNDFLHNTTYDIIIFLDSDAWIQNGVWLNSMMNKLIEDENKHGCFSRDPYIKKNTFINSGSFIIKNNDFIKQMYKNMLVDMYHNTDYHNNWPWDQYYVSKTIFENKDHFVIFVPDVLNTPIGKVFRHNWLKNQKLNDDVDELKKRDNVGNLMVVDNPIFIEEDYYDKEPFPNASEEGYEYFF
jgi:hypothetical protein